MTPQLLKVSSILWDDEDSGQKTVEFSNSHGEKFTCFVDGADVEVGKMTVVYEFRGFDYIGDFAFMNDSHEKYIRNINKWDVEIKGRVVSLFGDAAIVDCGGVLVSLYGLAFPLRGHAPDPTVIGVWVGASILRLEAILDSSLANLT